MRHASRSALSLAEVLIAACILAMGLVPILGSLHAAGRDARLMEFHTQALVRARGLLEAAQVWGPAAFDKLLAGQSVATVPVSLPAGKGGLAPAETFVSVRMGKLDECVTVSVLERRGAVALYLLKARVAWQSAIEPGQYEVELVTIVGDPRASLIASEGLP